MTVKELLPYKRLWNRTPNTTKLHYWMEMRNK